MFQLAAHHEWHADELFNPEMTLTTNESDISRIFAARNTYQRHS